MQEMGSLVFCENCLLRDWGDRSQAYVCATALAVNTYIVKILFHTSFQRSKLIEAS